jgi:superfamily II DNA or RNA helicase
MDKGLISNIKINAMILNHNELEFSENVFNIKKRGDGKKAFLLEREFIQKSLRRKLFIKKLVEKFNGNSLILFNNVAYGTELYNYLRDNIIGKYFYYIDGNTDAEKRSIIKQNMEITDDGIPKILIGSYGTTSTGVNIKAIMNIVFADSSKSDTRIRQSLGRGLRLHADKLKLIVFDLVDRFHTSYENILYKQYISRKDNIYKKQEFPFNEIKVNI